MNAKVSRALGTQKVTSIRLDDDVVARIEHEKKINGIGRSFLINKAVRLFLGMPLPETR